MLLEDYNDLVSMVQGSGVLALPVGNGKAVRSNARVPAAADWCEGLTQDDGAASFEAAGPR